MKELSPPSLRFRLVLSDASMLCWSGGLLASGVCVCVLGLCSVLSYVTDDRLPWLAPPSLSPVVRDCALLLTVVLLHPTEPQKFPRSSSANSEGLRELGWSRACFPATLPCIMDASSPIAMTHATKTHIFRNSSVSTSLFPKTPIKLYTPSTYFSPCTEERDEKVDGPFLGFHHILKSFLTTLCLDTV